MAFNLKGRSFLKVIDFSQREMRFLLDLSRDLKRAKYTGTEQQHLKGKNICLIFEKSSTRTMCAFEVAAMDQGAGVTYLGPSGSQIGYKESMKDTARVLGRMYDAIEYRGFAQETVEELSAYAGVPVFNGLTDEFHPTQMLADLLTMREHSDKPLHDISYAFVGDARSNMGHSLMIAGCLMGMDVRIAAPKANWPSDEFLKPARKLAETYAARLMLTEDPQEAVKGCDFIHTDVWVSMGEPNEVWQERIKLLTPYRVDSALMAATGVASTKFMHCLPAFHNRETKVGEEMFQKFGVTEMEVTEQVFESPAGVQFEQAENRMHTIKAILVATIGS
ncbi:ornithine carbamoyltransferase [Algihabitans albus]|uniref:ornithine carbamoyltransferase n=1 Tax=Algihabitans albus TaxID=2164067 RepID=UPI000E5CFECA|nr:ornithine carbamoyltransferase [Algihabitans albus]